MSGRDRNCMFHLGFFAQQPKQWLHLRGQISFHVRGPKAGWVRWGGGGGTERSDSHTATAEYNLC